MKRAAGILVAVALLPGVAVAAAPNDAAADAQIVTAPSITQVDTTGATVEPGEWTGACGPAGATVWFRIDGVPAVTVIATDGSGYDTVVTVFRGAAIGGDVVACNDDAVGRASRVTLSPTSDTLFIQVAGWGAETGLLRLQVQPAASITGTVRNATGDVIPEICVRANPATSGVGGTATTGPDGSYAIGGLLPGTYVVRLTECASPRRYGDAWYGGADEASAARVAAPASGIDVTLAAVGAIAGRIVDQHGRPARACVGIDHDGATWRWSDPDGTYELPRLSPGAYGIAFDDLCGYSEFDSDGVRARRSSIFPRSYEGVMVSAGATTNLEAHVFAFPYVDLSVGPVTYAAAALPTEPNVISVPIRNLGDRTSSASLLDVVICPTGHPLLPPFGDCALVTAFLEPFAPGAERVESLSWDGRGFVGRVSLRVEVYTGFDLYDADNRATGSGYVHADAPVGVNACPQALCS